MAIHIGRREFVAALGGTAAAWPLTAHAQQPAMSVIGFLHGGSPDGHAPFVAAFRQGLREAGLIEGQNATIEYCWAEGRYERLPALAADLVHRQVTVIAAGSTPAAVAAKSATSTIPIVFQLGIDPVPLGLVASLNRPRGNVTGVYNWSVDLGSKQLGLLHELVPRVTAIAALVNPNFEGSQQQLKDVEAAARELGLQLIVLKAGATLELETEFATMAQQGTGAFVVGGDAFLLSRRDQIVTLASRHAIPAIYFDREFAVAGGLMSYGTDISDSYRQAGIYTGRILRGEKPADLPVWRSTKFQFVINLKTAKALGLDVPPGFSARADEIIE